MKGYLLTGWYFVKLTKLFETLEIWWKHVYMFLPSKYQVLVYEWNFAIIYIKKYFTIIYIKKWFIYNHHKKLHAVFEMVMVFTYLYLRCNRLIGASESFNKKVSVIVIQSKPSYILSVFSLPNYYKGRC